ncbi:S46 family peptidase [Marinilabilia rubra]|uniref:Dipeptidyl-peptidase n=1 Tax=Marinilabilia rubra TaxID=2162893 RepID=A0A2U2B8E0_9BACT|nr:S46 family peptidase [Marinilabilia rubra]PWD99314.1 serine protease [Marinilabilia rubra]
MKKMTAVLVALLISFAGSLKADEGMWLLPLIKKLNIEKMQEKGLQLSAEDIYSVNQSSLKDAIVIFGGGCTGEMISDKGLILTNHHCGYGTIQELSTVEDNYLEEGFWAKTMGDEIPAPGLSVTFMKRMEDVTDKIEAGLNEDMSEEERRAAIEKTSTQIADSVKGDSHYRTLVRDFYGGNQYYLIVYEVFNDVRFVGAPPSSIGKFGHDTDNWMWPRHTGDFSMFRVYADKDGNPAEYSADNVPLKPAHHLPVSLKGYEKEDFAMTLGFPGSTQRYLTSWGIDERMNIFNFSLIKPRGVKQDIWQEAMNTSDKIRLQYASKYSRSSNYWKNSIGMNRGLKNLNVLAKKQKLEEKFQNWVEGSPEREAEYGDVLPSLEKAYSQRSPYYLAQNFVRECMLRGTEIVGFSLAARDLEKALEDEDQEKIDAAVESLKARAKEFYKDYHAATDQEVMSALFELYFDEIDDQFYPSFFEDIKTEKEDGFEDYADKLFRKSFFVSREELFNFLENPKLNKLQKDPAFKAGKSTIDLYLSLMDKTRESNLKIDRNHRLFIAGLKEMNPDKVYYDDANFSMRLSYGEVGNYEPRDAVIYKHYTTLKGVMEKEKPNDYEFAVPSKLKELYRDKNYGRYAAEDGHMRVCFTTDNDITGGNSGSPVINAKGELFGLAFDGNWEAMSGDIAFEQELQKCINVDIRYVLFIIDKYAGATNLIDEMTIVE